MGTTFLVAKSSGRYVRFKVIMLIKPRVMMRWIHQILRSGIRQGLCNHGYLETTGADGMY